MSSNTTIRTLDTNITTISVQFNRFAPFGYRRFVAVGNRATALRLKDGRILLLNPVELNHQIKTAVHNLGGVHFLAADLGHHMYIKDYLSLYPEAKVIGVKGLDQKRKDIKWDFVYSDHHQKPEDVFGFSDEIETVLFEGFITRAVAWYLKDSGTLILSDLLMNLPCTEQYDPPSHLTGPISRYFAMGANPWSTWMRMLIYYVATTDFVLVRRDAKRVSELDIRRIIPCHGDVIADQANEAWNSVYKWFLQGPTKPGLRRRFWDLFMRVQRRLFLM